MADRCPGTAEYGHGLTATTVHSGDCCRLWAEQNGARAADSEYDIAVTIDPGRTLDELVADLDNRDEKWDMYRLATGGWCVKLGDPTARSVHGDTIKDALTAAIASPPLPIVPPRPICHLTITVERSGSKWRLVSGGNQLAGNLPTKRAATLLAETISGNVTRAARAWNDVWLDLVTNGVEDVDWRRR